MFTFLSKIKSFICRDCLERLAFCQGRIETLSEEQQRLFDENSMLHRLVDSLRQDYEELKNEYANCEKKPNLPDELYETDNVYRGQRVLYFKNGKITYTLPKMQDYFLVSKELMLTQAKLAGIRDGDSDYDKFVKAVRHVQRKFKYRKDIDKYGYEENWEPIENVVHTGVGDCESLSMLVVMICRHSGVPANKVFMAVGIYYDPVNDAQFGHAWPVFREGVWYVGEPTSYCPVRRWENVKVKYHALWGLGNDVFSCKIKGDKDYPG